jgi:hypothetical protein
MFVLRNKLGITIVCNEKIWGNFDKKLQVDMAWTGGKKIHMAWVGTKGHGKILEDMI